MRLIHYQSYVLINNSILFFLESSTVMISPYLSELAKLRLERLKIDEDFLLERRRQQELKRLKGPAPGW